MNNIAKQSRCPSCDFIILTDAVRCFNCGASLVNKPGQNTWRESILVSKEATVALVVGFTAAAIIVFGDFSFCRFVLGYFVTLVHEFGHSIFGWFLGYFSIPAFDFTHGGGMAITMGHEPNKGLLLAVCLFFGWLIYSFRRYKLICISLAAIFLFLALSSLYGWERLVISYGGHATVVIMAGIFFFRGLSNVAVHHFVERILYFFLSALSILKEYRFTSRLKSDNDYLCSYLEGKGGIVNDFPKISETLNIPLETIVNFHTFFCLLVPVMSYFIYVIAMKNYSRGT